MKAFMLNKMCLNETYRSVRVGKYLITWIFRMVCSKVKNIGILLSIGRQIFFIVDYI